MRHLHSYHVAVYVYEKVQKVTQVCLMGNGALEQVLPGLRWFRIYFHILGTDRCEHFLFRQGVCLQKVLDKSGIRFS